MAATSALPKSHARAAMAEVETSTLTTRTPWLRRQAHRKASSSPLVSKLPTT
jgi:hypothetical protein